MKLATAATVNKPILQKIRKLIINNNKNQINKKKIINNFSLVNKFFKKYKLFIKIHIVVYMLLFQKNKCCNFEIYCRENKLDKKSIHLILKSVEIINNNKGVDHRRELNQEPQQQEPQLQQQEQKQHSTNNDNEDGENDTLYEILRSSGIISDPTFHQNNFESLLQDYNNDDEELKDILQDYNDNDEELLSILQDYRMFWGSM